MDIDSGYDEISDKELDTLVQQYHQENPGGGCAYIIGHLCAAHFLMCSTPLCDSLYDMH